MRLSAAFGTTFKRNRIADDAVMQKRNYQPQGPFPVPGAAMRYDGLIATNNLPPRRLMSSSTLSLFDNLALMRLRSATERTASRFTSAITSPGCTPAPAAALSGGKPG